MGYPDLVGEEVLLMRVNRGLLGWGVFFIVTGAVALAVRNGGLDPALAARAWELWPLILIGLGLGLVLARTRLAVVGGLVVAVTCGLMAGAVTAGATSAGTGLGACGIGAGGGAPRSFPGVSGSLVEDAGVRLEMSCGKVDITAAPGAGWTLAGSSPDGRAPDVLATDTRLDVRAPNRTGLTLASASTAWQVALPQATSINLTLVVNAGSAKASLGGARVGSLSLTVNAGDARLSLRETAGLGQLAASVNAGSLAIDLPASGLAGHLTVNAGSAKICTPDGVGLRLRTADHALGSTNFAQRGLLEADSTWTTPGYDAAPIHIDLDVSANLGSITLNPEDGCA